jgi:hypothetical protein
MSRGRKCRHGDPSTRHLHDAHSQATQMDRPHDPEAR